MKLPPYAHQTEDTGTVLRQPFHLFGLRVGFGKSRIIVDAACTLEAQRQIDTLLVVAPPNVRSVWADPDPVMGEFSKWVWPSTDFRLYEYSTQHGTLPKAFPLGLTVLVTNPEFIRRENRLTPLIEWLREGRKTMLVGDESWLYQGPSSEQTKAMKKLRRECARVYLLNGTPGEIKQQYAQFNILHPRIFDRGPHPVTGKPRPMSWWQFRGHFCVMGGFQNKEIVGYKNQEEYFARTKPYITIRDDRRLINLGAEPVRTQIDVPLSAETWKHYVSMRDDMVAWLDTASIAQVNQAGVKSIRLAQICNGFVGGVEALDGDLFDPIDLVKGPVREVGREKLDALLTYLDESWYDSKLVIFSRFKPDVRRTTAALTTTYPAHGVRSLYGESTPEDRRLFKQMLAPGGPTDPFIGVANVQSGGVGLNFSAASLAIFMGNDYSPKNRAQAEGRLDRPGQQGDTRFVDMIATGPKGESTIDRVIAGALRRGDDMAKWTKDQWRAALLTP